MSLSTQQGRRTDSNEKRLQTHMSHMTMESKREKEIGEDRDSKNEVKGEESESQRQRDKKEEKRERAKERREKRRQEVSLLRTIPYSDHQR